MRALKLTKDAGSRQFMKAQLNHLLGEAERIKHSESWTVQSTTSKSLERDAQIVDITKVRKLREPLSTRQLTRAEEILLLKASKLNGFKFPPWKDAPRDSDFALRSGEPLFLYVDAVLDDLHCAC